MKILRRVVLRFALAWLAAVTALAQGPLTPPGPPAPVMKTLDQVEARTPISTLPFTISQPGSYYLTQNLVFAAPTGNAITIAVGNVTLDLNGFTLSSTAEVTGHAILGSSGMRNVTVKNGAISGTTTVTITGPEAVNPTWVITRGGFGQGVAIGGGGAQFQHLRISGCRNDGLSAVGAVVDHVSASQNGNEGISSGLGIVTNSVAELNGSTGIDGSSVTNCRSNSNKGVGISGTTVSDCNATYNGNRGIFGTTITNCVAIKNTDTGLMSNSGSVVNSTANSNKGDGIYGVMVIGCLATENRTHGIVVARTARDNESSGNGATADGAGIFFAQDGARIENNNCFDNDWGIKGAVGTNSFIVRNSARGNGGTPANAGASGNFDFDRSTNTYGPVITQNGDMSANSATLHPAANIQY